MPTFTGNIYDLGQYVQGVTETNYTPHIWYDQSKNYKNGTNIFEDLSVPIGLMLGDSEDDVWSYEEILNEIMQYLNLHIMMIGFDYYIFDWNTPRTEVNIEWLDIMTGETKIETFNIINVTKDMYGGDDTQITMDDVYNQIQVTDNIEKLDDVIESPFDNNNLIPLNAKTQYMTEFGSDGADGKTFVPFVTLVQTGSAANELPARFNEDVTWTKEWWMQIYKNNNWSFKLNNVDNYSEIPTDGNGLNYDCWRMLKKLYNTPFYSGIVGFGSGDKVNNKNMTNIQNIDVKDKYICIAINGNGVDGSSNSEYPQPSTYTTFPNDNDVQNCGLNIEYNFPQDGNYSPADENITNYIVFSGDILMTIPQQMCGVSGFRPHIYEDDWVEFKTYQERYNKQTLDANDNKAKYCDYYVFTRKNNNFITFKTYARWNPSEIISGYDFRGHLTPSAANDDHGTWYQQLYYKNYNATHTDNRAEGDILVSPPIVDGNLAKRFKYALGSNTYYGQYDVIKYVDVLACQLKIGDKYCDESYDSEGNKVFSWKTTDELIAEQKYHVMNGNPIYDAYVYLAINIDDGEYLIGDSHKIYNNIYANMGLDNTTGMAIPIKNSDHLSGELRFKIIGPVNNTWDNGIRRHPTWFRHTKLTANEVPILPHVGQIWIKSFDVKLVSDKGKQTSNTDNDIIYVSDEQKKFINKHDDTEFKFTTALTAEEAAAMQVEITANKSDVIGPDNIPILYITNTVTDETDKPEKHYVDAYYNEYKDTHIMVDTTLHNSNRIKYFNKYRIGYLNKSFFIQTQEYNVKTDKKLLTLKEI